MKILVAAALFTGLMAASGAASAMPLAPTSTTADVIKVAGGCGPGFHRGPYGGCRPNRGPVIVRPIVRGCPPAFRGPYGHCRR